MIIATAIMMAIQDVPTEIAKKDLPKSAICVVCDAAGEGHGAEKPAAGVMYKGKAYYFCNVKEVKSFKEDPAGYLPPVLPRSLPKLTLADTSGTVWDEARFKGKTVLIDWWATWCGPCKEMMPILDAIQEKYRDKGLTLLSVSIDEKKSDFDAFLKKRKFAGVVAWDNAQAWTGFSIKAIPALFLVKDGQIVMEWRGKQKRETIEKALGL
jgi:thiol-disulfide isomerase/thioredoxin